MCAEGCDEGVEHVGAEGDERWRSGVGYGEEDLEAKDCWCIRTCEHAMHAVLDQAILVLRYITIRPVCGMLTVTNEKYARPHAWVVWGEAHKDTLGTCLLEPCKFYEEMLFAQRRQATGGKVSHPTMPR